MDKQEFCEGFEKYLQEEHFAFDTQGAGMAAEIYHALMAYMEKVDVREVTPWKK